LVEIEELEIGAQGDIAPAAQEARDADALRHVLDAVPGVERLAPLGRDVVPDRHRPVARQAHDPLRHESKTAFQSEMPFYIFSRDGGSAGMTVAAIERSLDLIEVLAGEAAALELGTLAARARMPKSAAHRTLTTLVARGLVVQDEATQGYALALRF